MALAGMTFNQQVRGRRLAALLALSMLPLLIALYWSTHPTEGTAEIFFFDFSYIVYFQFVIPVVTLVIGTSLIRDEISSRMISYLVTNACSRRQLVIGRIAGYAIPAFAVVAIPIIAAYVLVIGWNGTLGGSLAPLAILLLAAACGVMAYGTLYNLMGVYIKHPLMAGLLFAFIWETVLANLPGRIPYATVSFYLHSLVAGLSDVGETGAWAGGTSVIWALCALVFMTVVFTAATVRRFQKMDVV
jgi:ABC-2 type transport system permease protein